MDPMQIVLGRLERLENIEALLAALVEQKAVKEWYTIAEVAEIVGRSSYCVREWARKGQARAVKAANGRGWLIPHEELTRLRNEGPIPEQQVRSIANGNASENLARPLKERG